MLDERGFFLDIGALDCGGSSMPQCAVIGGRAIPGQDSPAALSQTVKMKSITGAPGCANSFQLFERKSSVG